MKHNFGKLKNVLKVPDLTELQKNSYEKFLNVGIGEILKEVSPVIDYNKTLNLTFDEYKIVYPEANSIEYIEKGLSYSAKLLVTCRLLNTVTGEIKESEVCFGEIPVMNESNEFILNGIQKTIVSQMVRSPGMYYTVDKKVVEYRHVKGLVMPHTGAWLEITNDTRGAIFVEINKQGKVLVSVFLRVLGLTEEEIKEILTEKYYEKCMLKDNFLNYDEALVELYRKVRKGEPFSKENAKALIEYTYFSEERYTLKEVGRFKLNKKTGLDVPLDVKVLTREDLLAFVKGYVEVLLNKAQVDDIDHIANRRIKTAGELVAEKFKTGILKMTKQVKEQMSLKGIDETTPSNVINPRMLQNVIKEFFLQSALSQMLESTNPLSAITNKRRVSAIGKGGVNKERAGMEIRDVHYSHYGRLCHIETPDGETVGLINSLAMYAEVDKYGFITTPYRKVDGKNGIVTDEICYLNADDEEGFYVAQVDMKIDENGKILDKLVKARYRGEVVETEIENISFMDISSLQTISVSAAMIPFLHNDDATRAGMGCSMQRQAVPLISAKAPLVGTGVEVIMGDEYTRKSDIDGVVSYADNDKIVVSNKKTTKTYRLINFKGTKKETCIRECPIVRVGDVVKKGDILYTKFGVDKSNMEIATGRTVTAAYMPWEGFNYEDSIGISDRLIKDDVFTSIHIQKEVVEIREIKSGQSEKFTSNPDELRDISNAQRAKLDKDGMPIIGMTFKEGEVLVGKVAPKLETNITPEERLVRVVIANKSNMKNVSHKIPKGEWGTVIKVDRYTKEDNVELKPGVLEVVYVYLAKKRKIEVGDKMAGRHGNKGVVSVVIPESEMPFLEDGRVVDIVLNPLGVPSRMNIGQILETHLGFAAEKLNVEYVVPAFDGPSIKEIKQELKKAGLDEDGKSVVYDGRTGEPFDSRITVGKPYMLRLSHIGEEKVHARSTGNYSLITQQPLGGKAQGGGQRFGEMEVWALQAHGAAHTLQEMLTLKSDDVIGRERTMSAILKGQEVPKPALPESYKVLERQLSALGCKLTINGIDNITRSSEEDLKETRYILDKSIVETIKKTKDTSDEDMSDGLEDIDTEAAIRRLLSKDSQ